MMADETLQQLAALEPDDDILILSIYLDMRPQESGERPGQRVGLTVLKDRLREIEKTLGPRGAALDSFLNDVARIERYLEQELSSETQGLAFFAASGRELFEVIEAGVPFEDQVSAAALPDLFQLARLLDDQESAVVALVDTSTLRLFVTRYGHLDEVEGTNDPNTKLYRKRSMGGWKQMHYQRNIDHNRADFARQAAVEIEQLVTEVQATQLILAGDEVAIPFYKQALSTPMTELLHDEVLRLDIRTPRDDVQSEIAPLLAQLERKDDHVIADQLIEAVRANGLGISGLAGTRQALEYGQVDVLLLAPETELDPEERNELIRLATQTSASIEIVADHKAFMQLGGVGALLRYRWPGDTKQAHA
jgi:hypothetical protein